MFRWQTWYLHWRARWDETQLLIDLHISTFEALQLALPLSSTYFICNNLMLQLKPYQIRNIIYILALHLFRNQVKVVKGGKKRTGKKRSQYVVFQTQPLPCPYGQWRQGGAGELLKAPWHSWAFHVGKYCWVSEGLATELPVKKQVLWWNDAC